ncbi:MAG: histone deacetylase [Phycisphaerae bacterium]|jgi:acetoin utilization deacetylase AcuC-like enzyme
MSSTGILLDDRFKRHSTGQGHPERPERLTAIEQGLSGAGLLESCTRIEPALIPEGLLQCVHTHDYLTRLDAACRQAYPYIDVPDSAIGPESYEIARLAAGGTVKAARLIAGGDLKRAFCAVRPPGHHAEIDRSLGFCLLNNPALAASVLRDEFSIDRLLVLDWDVHHCNGTQNVFAADPRVLVISVHGHPTYLYPGTGYENEVGVDRGRGYTINIPMLPGARDEDFQAAFRQRIVPAVGRFAPQFVLLSVGYDAHVDDPIGNLSLSDEIFGWMTEVALELADRHAEGRVLSILEGGYNLDVLRRCIVEHVRLLNS